MIEVKDDELQSSTEVEVVSEDGMIGDGDNGIPKIEVDPATGEPIDAPEALTDTTPKYSLADRLEAAVERRREEIAKSIFNGEDPQPEAFDSDAESTETEGSGESVTGEEETSSEE